MLGKRFLLLISLTLFSFHSFSNDVRPIITVAVSHSPPYSVISSEGPPKALILDIFNILGKSLNFDVKAIECPLIRCFRLMKSGKANATGNLIFTEERAQFLDFIQPAYMELQSSFVFYALKENNVPLKTYEDLYDKRIGVTRGAAYFNRFDLDNKLTKIEVVDQTKTYAMLFNYRVDLIIAIEETSAFTSKFLLRDMNKVEKLPYQHNEFISGYMAFSKNFKNKALVKKITKQLNEMKYSGELDSLLANYDLPPLRKENTTP